ncbi:MAG: CHAT domain-containing protein [Acidobacteriota bacterium]
MSTNRLTCAALCLALSLSSDLIATSNTETASHRQSNAQQNNTAARQIEPDRPIERELAGGETHLYEIRIREAQYLRLIVNQKSLDVVVAVTGPDGKKIIEADNPNGMEEAERVSLVSQTEGVYRIEIRPRAKDAKRGRYEANIEELRAATEMDTNRVAGERAFFEAERLRVEGTAASRRESIKKYEEAIALYRSADDRKGEAEALNNAGAVCFSLSDYRRALDFYNRALPLFQALGDRRGEGDTLNNIGNALSSAGEPRRAIDYLTQSLAVKQAIGNRKGAATTLNNIGAAYFNLAEYTTAIKFLNQALALRRSLGDRDGQASTLANLSAAWNLLGEYQKAIDHLSEALQLARARGNRNVEATALRNIGANYLLLGEPQRARDHYNQALSLCRATGDRSGEAFALLGIGNAHFREAEYQKAIEFINQSLQLHRAGGNRRGEASALILIGQVYDSQGEHQKAIEAYGEALSIARAAGERSAQANSLIGMGRAQRMSGNIGQAIEMLNQALEIKRAVGDRAGQASALNLLAQAEIAGGNLAEARTHSEAAIRIVESLRSKVDSRNLRASYLSSVRDFYELNVDVLMQLHHQRPSEGFDAAALQASERARARSLLETLIEAGADIRQGADAALIERERALERLISAKAERQTRLLGGRHTPEQALEAASEIQSLTAEYDHVQSKIRASSPRYADLTQPRPPGLKEIQQLLDTDTLLLEYLLGKERSYLWAITSTSLATRQLPARADIEAEARRFYKLASSDSPSGEIAEASRNLSNLLLAPVAGQLKAKRIVIVADGTLHYVPFAALPVSNSRESRVESLESKKDKAPGLQTPGSGLPLIADHEVVTLPSASTLALLREEEGKRRRAPKALVVLADPVFRDDDTRVRNKSSAAAADSVPKASNVGLERSASESGLADLRFGRLIGTRREAAAILALVPATDRKQAFDFEASRRTATGAGIGDYRILHFATHGLLNSEHPELSGLVLSLVDESGRPQNGFLRLHEIYNLKLAADLVVLSACRTALGRNIRGEGLMGIARGFMHAGARRVVASLWKVDDRATAELMKHFYRRMLTDGMSPSAALAEAQRAMLKQRQWQAPYYWAAWTLQGEWK